MSAILRAPVWIGDVAYVIDGPGGGVVKMKVDGVQVSAGAGFAGRTDAKIIKIHAMAKKPALLGGVYIWGMTAFATYREADEQNQTRKAAPLPPEFTEEDD